MASATVIRQLALRTGPRARPAVLLPLLQSCVLPSAPAHGRRLASSSSASPAGPPPIYKTKKVWPPDFSQLSPQEQLRFEKRFKRRVALRTARPRWVKFVKLAQLFSIVFVIIYTVLFMEWTHGPQPFQGFRDWLFGSIGALQGEQNGAIRRSEAASDSSTAPAEQPAKAK